MTMALMLWQRALVERAVPAVAEDGSVHSQWQTVSEAEPCLLDKVSAEEGGACVGRCYFSDQSQGLEPAGGGRLLRVTVEAAVYYVRAIYRQGGGRGPGMLVAELEL